MPWKNTWCSVQNQGALTNFPSHWCWVHPASGAAFLEMELSTLQVSILTVHESLGFPTKGMREKCRCWIKRAIPRLWLTLKLWCLVVALYYYIRLFIPGKLLFYISCQYSSPSCPPTSCSCCCLTPDFKHNWLQSWNSPWVQCTAHATRHGH